MTDLQQQTVAIKRAIREVYATETTSTEEVTEVIEVLKDIRDQADHAIDDLLLKN